MVKHDLLRLAGGVGGEFEGVGTVGGVQVVDLQERLEERAAPKHSEGDDDDKYDIRQGADSPTPHLVIGHSALDRHPAVGQSQAHLEEKEVKRR